MDKKIGAWWAAHKPTKRRLIQVYAALLYNAHIKGFIKGDIYTGPVKNICVPGFNCYSCPGAVAACPLGALQNALASSGNRAPWYVLGILMLFGLTLGRTICGWLCPIGLIQELFYKIPVPKLKKNRVTHVLSYLKYVILVVFVIAVPIAYSAQNFPVPAFCKYICPAGTFEGAMGLLANPVNAAKFSMLNILFTRKFIVMVIIFAACIFIYRAFCRFLCPLGAIYGLFSRLSVLGVKVEASKCTHCQKCVAHCKMDINRVGDHECIHCASCVAVCPTNAISFKAGKITLLQNESASAQKNNVSEAAKNQTEASVQKNQLDSKIQKKRLYSGIAWAIALVFLFGVMWYVNRDEKPKNTQTKPAQTVAETSESVETAEAESAADTKTSTDDKKTASADEASSEAVTKEGSTKEAKTEETTASTQDDDTPVGYEVGMKCPDFTVPLYQDGGEFSLSANKGKVTVINFWATWCTPCVAELPYFQKLYENYGDQIALVAIHSNLVTDDVENFLEKEGLQMPFGLDEDGSVITSLGGSTQLPMTVVVDKDGKIVYNKVGSVTYELLESLIKPIL